MLYVQTVGKQPCLYADIIRLVCFPLCIYVWFATDVDCVVYAGFTHSCDVRRFSEKGDTKLTLLVLNRFSEIVHSHQPILQRVPRTLTTRYRSFIHHRLIHYQPKSKLK